MTMQSPSQAVCVKCNHAFTIEGVADKKSHLLHCVRCGRGKEILPADLTDYYQRYQNLLLNTSEPERKRKTDTIQPLFSHEHLDTRKYIFMVEHLAGYCVCGAVFRFSGKPRCPRCRSTAIRKSNTGKRSQSRKKIFSQGLPG